MKETGGFRPGLYGGDEQRQAEQRQRIQQRNWEAISLSAAQLFSAAWELNYVQEVAVTGLLYNAARLRAGDRDRYRLSIRIDTHPPYGCDPDVTLSLIDDHPGVMPIVMAQRHWYFEDLSSTAPIRLDSFSETTLGYEGNGYGIALLRLTNPVLEKVTREIVPLAEKIFPQMTGQPVYAVIVDQAEPAREWHRSIRRQDVATRRAYWTSQMVQRYLPNYISGYAAVSQKLGFIPKYFDESNCFVALYREAAE